MNARLCIVRCLSFVVGVTAWCGAARAEAHPVWLEIPGVPQHVNDGEALMVPRASVATLRIHLNRQPNEVAYSRITTWVNAFSANIVASESSNDDGILCTLDLSRNPELSLHPGRNSIEVTFKDRWNEFHYASFILQMPGGATAKSAAAGASGPVYNGPRRFAIAVGVGKYKFGGRGVQNIPYAEQDAAAFFREVTSPGGGNVPAENAHLLLNEDATADKITAALRDIAMHAHGDDVVLVYLNLNGAYDPNDPDKKYLLAYDSDPDSMSATAIAIGSMPSLLGYPGGSHHVIVFSDTSHGEVTLASEPGKVTGAGLVNLYLARAFSLDGQAAMESADIHQVSHEGAEWHDAGAFTHYLVEGLAGAADANHDGTVTTQELFRYVQMKVGEATMDTQLPMVAPGKAGNVALSGLATTRQVR